MEHLRSKVQGLLEGVQTFTNQNVYYSTNKSVHVLPALVAIVIDSLIALVPECVKTLPVECDVHWLELSVHLCDNSIISLEGLKQIIIWSIQNWFYDLEAAIINDSPPPKSSLLREKIDVFWDA